MTATTAQAPRSLAPDRLEKATGWTALILLAVVLVAIARGSTDWAKIPWTIWLHLATMIAALVLTPAILWRRRGDSRHRTLGYVWVAAMAVTALITFAIRLMYPGHLSWIHLLSAYTLIQLPIIVWSARKHDHVRHRRGVRRMAIGALLIAGFFTLPAGRLLGHWLYG